MAADFDTITTAALSQLVGVSEGTIKSWKSRGKFEEGVHYAGRAWLPAAVDKCRELATRLATGRDAPATDPVAADSTSAMTVADFAIQWGSEEIKLADQIADMQVRRAFHQLVEARLQIRLQAFRDQIANDPLPFLVDPLYWVAVPVLQGANHAQFNQLNGGDND